MNIENSEIRCKFCDSRNVIRYGHFKNEQRWWCKDCQRKFADNGALPGMKTPANQISSALGMYYEGMSLNAIRRQLEQEYHNYPSDSTVYEWMDRFTQKAINEAKSYHPKVGGTWVADETVLRIGGGKYWLIDIIDTDTRFLLATKLSYNRNLRDIQSMMENARNKAGKTPKQVLTDGWKGYIDGIERAFGADSKHIQTTPFETEKGSTELIERWHGTLKDRTKVMRGLKDGKTAQLILDGWLIHYNIFRPHESLDDNTPAEKAGLKFKYQNWKDVTNNELPQKAIEVETIILPKIPEYQPSIYRPIRHRRIIKRHRIIPPSVKTMRF